MKSPPTSLSALATAFVLASPLAGCRIEHVTVTRGGPPPATELVGWLELDGRHVALPGQLTVVIDGDARTVEVDGDGYFDAGPVSPGDHALHLFAGDRWGRTELIDVRRGELITVEAWLSRGSLEVYVLGRASPPDPEPVEVGAADIVLELPSGEVWRDVIIHGDGVVVSGDPGYDCDDPERTVLYGDLVVYGDDVVVAVAGALDLYGYDLTLDESCGYEE